MTKRYDGDAAVFFDQVQKASQCWDAVAASQSVAAVASGRKEDLDIAKAYVARAHAAKELSKTVIEIFRSCFHEVHNR